MGIEGENLVSIGLRLDSSLLWVCSGGGLSEGSGAMRAGDAARDEIAALLSKSQELKVSALVDIVAEEAGKGTGAKVAKLLG